MPAAVPVAIRQALIQRHRQGESLPHLAAEFNLSRWTVRALWRRYRAQGPPGLTLHYAACGSQSRRTPPLLYRAALTLRRRHPAWGANLIHYLLHAKWPQQPVPHVRTLQKWFRRAGLASRRRRLLSAPRHHSQTPHAVWQMDAVEQLPLADGTWLCWLTLTDEASGAILAAELFPQRYWSQIAAPTVREALRRVFARWGLPTRLRVDNGAPWGSADDLPPAFALWLTGLGVGVIWNRPHHPQENGRVERTQGVLQQWAELERCANFAQAHKQVAWAVEIQREHYPAIAGQSRAAAYPELREGARPYDPAQEEQQWELQRVYQLLERGVWPRRVSAMGQVGLYGRLVGIGQRYSGQTVVVRFDGAQAAWVFTDTAGQELARRAAPELSQERILALDVARVPQNRRGSDHQRTKLRNLSASLPDGGKT